VTILVVEDNATLARSISRCLHQLGYHAKLVSTLTAARRVLRDEPVAAVCLDLQLPDGSGLDLLEHDLRPTRPDMPAVIITGAGSDADRARAAHFGVLAFLIKPFALSELASIFDLALGSNTKTPTRIEGVSA
jgi:two-component system, OmpR family, response regulator